MSARPGKPRAAAAEASTPPQISRGVAIAAAAVLLGLALWVYAPAMGGPFLSDDQHYVERNPYVHELSLESLAAILEPDGPASRAIENWAPVQLLIHSLAWQVFEEDVRGHHAVQLFFHLLATVLLVPVLRRFGLGPRATLLAAAIFLLHPASVEVGAWISQLKTTTAMCLALTAILAHPRRPLLGAALYGLALLAKPIAAFALPVVAVAAWNAAPRTRGGEPSDPVLFRAAPWLLLWLVILVGFFVVEYGIFQSHASGSLDLAAQQTTATRLRSAIALVSRYFVMAATGFGTSAFHDPSPVDRFGDPWFLAGCVALLAVGARSIQVLVQRKPEAVFWAWAAAGYAPLSQIFPFPFPMADRYLYYALPGLLGGAMLASRDGIAWLTARLGRPALAPQFATALLLAGALLVPWFVSEARGRARLWSSRAMLMADAATNYPQGKSAALLRARQAASMGDVATTVAELRPVVDQGYNRFDVLLTDAAYRPVRHDPRFHALLQEMARWWLTQLGDLETPTQPDFYMVALSQALLGNEAAAREALDRGLALGGPYDERLREHRRALSTGGAP